MVVRVAINGYGTIGKRVADAVAKQPDMKLVGVAKTRPSFEARAAVERGYPLFVAGDGKIADFGIAGLPVAGPLDVIGDAPVGRLDHDLRRAALGCLGISGAACRDYALRFTWRASAQQFLDNLVPTHA